MLTRLLLLIFSITIIHAGMGKLLLGESGRGEEKIDGSTRVRTGDLLCVRQMR